MKNTILASLLFALLTITSVLWAAEKNNPSAEIAAIINELKSGEYTLDVSGFNATQNMKISEDPLKGEYEQYAFPPESVKGQDMYHYVIKFNKASRNFWIWRTGGFVYQNILYGPGYLDASGKIKWQKE